MPMGVVLYSFGQQRDPSGAAGPHVLSAVLHISHCPSMQTADDSKE
jgi:hypothetical protein